MKVALVGATGLVGRTMLKILEERNFPVSQLLPVASGRSKGKKVAFGREKISVTTMEEALKEEPALALFSAGGDVSREWAPRFAEKGTFVVDNSSAWRLEPGKHLCIPEVNGNALGVDDKIIANPNCSTIQLAMVLDPLYRKYGINRLVISTYQSVTGTGKAAVDQLENERSGRNGSMAYPYTIDQNLIPHCDDFQENGYTREEMKLTHETRKILADEELKITATAVRVPVQGGHSEAVNIEFKNNFDISEVRKILSGQAGIKIQDNPDVRQYPMPRYAQGKDEVFVGRIRRDESHPRALNLWIVADNLRKGAATNAVQIAETLKEKGLLPTQHARVDA